MTKEEYKGLLAKMIAEPDTANDTANSILEEIEKDFTVTEEAKKQIAAKDDQIKTLTSTVNSYKAREFLGTFGGDPKKEDPPKEKGIDWDKILKDAEVKEDGK